MSELDKYCLDNCPTKTDFCTTVISGEKKTRDKKSACRNSKYCTWEYGTCWMKDVIKETCKDCMEDPNINIVEFIKKNPLAGICAIICVVIFLIILIAIAGTVLDIKFGKILK
mgnify:CR=1 FL=1